MMINFFKRKIVTPEEIQEALIKSITKKTNKISKQYLKHVEKEGKSWYCFASYQKDEDFAKKMNLWIESNFDSEKEPKKVYVEVRCLVYALNALGFKIKINNSPTSTNCWIYI